MDIIRIKGCPPYDGDYEADLSRFTNGELRTIKKETGIRAAQLQTALIEGDQDAFVGLTVIVLERSGKFETIIPQILWDADQSSLEFIPDEDEDDAPSAEGNSPTPSEPDGRGEASAETPSSGESSSEPSDGQVLSLPPTGTQG